MTCGVCGGTLQTVAEARMGRYRGHTVEVQSEFMRCKDCGEEFFAPTQIRAHARAIKNEIRKKCGLLPPEKVAEIRNALHLTQEDLERLLGTGPKVVVRWESGKVIQSRGQDNLLRLLERDPHTLDSLREIEKLRRKQQAKAAVMLQTQR